MKITITLFLLIVSLPLIQVTYAAADQQSSATLKNGIWETKINKQIQIASDITNNQDRPQPFAYLVQVQNENGIVVSLSWLSGTLDPGQSLTPSQSWLPTSAGTYNAQIFVWSGVNNPDALSPPLTMKIVVT